MAELPWDLTTITLEEAERLFAEPLPNDPDEPAFCEGELMTVFRRVNAELLAALEVLTQRVDPNPMETVIEDYFVKPVADARAAIAKAKPEAPCSE